MIKEKNKIEKFSQALGEFTTGRPWLVVFSALLIVTIASIGLGSLKISNNYRVFFGEDNPNLIAFDEFQNTYSKNDNILFVIKPKNGRIFLKETLSVVERLTEESWSIPYAIRVDSVTNFQHSTSKGDDLWVDNLVRNPNLLDHEELKAKEQIAITEPLLVESLISPDGKTTGINVTLQFPEKELTELPEAMEVAHALANKIEAEYSNIEIAISGVAALNAAFADATIIDGITLFPVMFLILILVTWYILRNGAATFATMTLILLSTLSALGFAGYMGITFSPFSGTAPVVILTLAVADSIHILISMNAARKEGHSKIGALKESVRINFLAVTITSITTIIGFLALNFSEAPPFQDLGNIAAVGIATAWFLSLTFLPAMMTLLPSKAIAKNQGVNLDSVMSRLADFVIEKYRKILVGMAVVTFSLTALIPTIDLNDAWVNYFDHRVEFRGDAEFAQENLTGLYPIEFSVNSGAPEGISDPEFLENLESFTHWLKAQPEVRHVYSYSDIIKKLNMNLHGDNQEWYRLPEDRELAAQYLLLYELSLPFGLNLNDRISLDKSSTRITATLGDVPTRQTREFLNRADQWLRENTPEHMWAQPTGAPVMFSYISERNINDMTGGNAIALLLIAGVMVFALRSFSLGTLSLIPNAVPVLITFGIWALLVGQVGMAAATVSATSLGIIVDSSVHFLSKFVRARRERSLPKPEAIHYAFKTVGMALVANTIILGLGFSSLAYSSFAITAEMGILTTIAVIVALIVDFLLLPSLLLIGNKKTKETSNVYKNPIQQT